MQIIENSKVKEKLYIEKLENGITIMIIPKKDIQKKYAMIATHFGSMDNKFISPGEKDITYIPDGVAHFLEHKMFEQENGTNSLDTLTALGVNANAYTTTNHTAYLFECTDNFEPALDELMDYVWHPYFTDANVEKEKGIIGQEIMMYDDYPDWVVYMNAIKNMYAKSPINIDIAGSAESISKIDKDILYKCYDTFYNPANMVMCFAGDFNPDELINKVKENFKKIANNENGTNEAKRILEEEPEKIVSKEKEEKMEVSIPIFVIGIKDFSLEQNKCIDEKTSVKKHMAIEILLNMLIGKSSKLYKELYEEGMLMSELFVEYEFATNYAHIAITGQSKEPKTILTKLQEAIAELKQKGIEEEHFNRIKNMIYGNYVKEYDDVAGVSRMFVSDYFKGINSFEYLEEYSSVTIEYTKQILEEVFNEDKTVISIVSPK